jgi:hypothetical protein
LQKTKHETIDTIVVVRSGEPTFLNVQMKPTTLWVNISSTPSGASVTLDGISRGTTPASFELDLTDRTKRGSKQLQLTLTDHEPVNTTIDLRPLAAPLEKDYSLKKEKGSFSITSTPEGAQVFVGGQYKGTTPLHGSMEVGQYEVEVKLDGYTATKQNLRIDENGTNELSFTMRERDLSVSALPTKIGQLYGGGIIFKISEDGHGLIVALDDLGKTNWKRAKKSCESYDGGGYTDWYLPSKGELTELYAQKHLVNSALSREGFRKLQQNWYWSSTESADDYGWRFTIGSGTYDTNGLYNRNYVRAVRAF